MPYTDEGVRQRIASVKNWYHRIEVRPGIVTPGVNDSPTCLRLLNLPADCRGLRVLDLGTRDGFFAFELERRGAEVVAVDYQPCDATGFRVAAELVGSKVVYIQDNIYNLSPEKYGTFDLVLFLGLIYHLPDPLWCLSLVRAVCKNLLILETHAIDNCFSLPDGSAIPIASISNKLLDIPLMQFYAGDALNKDYSNYWGPNVKCMQEMLVESGFAVEEQLVQGSRAIFRCKVVANSQRHWQINVARGKLGIAA
jgi:tRNA (mo5U34)-methyltransferase